LGTRWDGIATHRPTSGRPLEIQSFDWPCQGGIVSEVAIEIDDLKFAR